MTFSEGISIPRQIYGLGAAAPGVL
jgi:hypothetical protein